MKSVILIPARMESSRFPGKPLAKIQGKPMVQWVYESAERSEATDVFIITDSKEIQDVVEAFGGSCIMTSSQARNGTERCQEAIEILDANGDDYDVIINVQGDEPLISHDDLDQMLNLFDYEEIDIATLIQPITDEEDYTNQNVVKAVPTLFDEGFCDICYFSRSPVPYMKSFKQNLAFKHIGVYGFTATAFEEIGNLEPTDIEESESLEQLRWIQNHLVVSGIVTENKLIGVDTEDDLRAVENFLTSKS